MFLETPRTTQIDKILQKRRPLANQVEAVEANLKKISATLKQLEAQRQHIINTVDDSHTIQKLQQLNYFSLQSRIQSELPVLNKLKLRFSRNTLNIGVIGRARQGKSRLLQSLTGLSKTEIPDGDDQHCTGVRSSIHHNSEVKETYAEVYFHTEQSFLNKVIAPYYKQLNLGLSPQSIEEFARNPIPKLLKSDKTIIDDAKYEHLIRYHHNLDKYRHCLFESSPKRISREQIREYVAQDTIDGQRIYFNYLAVREVKIFCSFPNLDVGNIALVDMPGLGDTGIGDEERMIQTLGQDIDVVLLIRMPTFTGDFWSKEDLDLYKMANGALKDLPLKEWSFLVLNNIKGSSNNRKNCDSLAAATTEKHIDVQDVIIADCTDSEEANRTILDRVLEYLEQKVELVDQKYASACQTRLIQLQKDVSAELNYLKKAWKSSSTKDWFPHFLKLFDQFWKDLTRELVRLTSSMISVRDTEDETFQLAVETAIESCRSKPGIPDLEEIEGKYFVAGGYRTAYEECLHEVRTHLSKQFLSLDIALKESLENAKSRVVKVLVEHGKLGNLSDGDGSIFLKKFAETIPDDLTGLKLGFETIATFDLQYRGLIQHRIRRHLDVLTPNRTPYELKNDLLDKYFDLKTGKIGAISPIQKIYNNLCQAQAEAVKNCERELQTLFKDPSQAGFAIVEEFVDRVLRAEGVKQEWQIFLQEVAFDVWTDELQSTIAYTKLRKDWMGIINEIERCNQLKSLTFQ